MKLKKIEITLNDNTKSESVDYLVSVLITQFELAGITAVILVHDVEVKDEQT